MIRFASDNFWMLMDQGGVVMWPLLVPESHRDDTG